MHLGRTCSDLNATLFFSADEIRGNYLLTKQPKPTHPARLNEVIRLVAQLGGVLARKGDGEPGVKTIWRGLDQVMMAAAGDSHTTAYGALGTLGFGIGTSDIERYLATQTLVYQRLKTMRVTVDGTLGPGVRSKDIVMALIEQIGAAGATGYALEFQGSPSPRSTSRHA